MMNAILFLGFCAGLGILAGWFMGKAARAIEEVEGFRRRRNAQTIRGGQTIREIAVFDPIIPVVCLVTKRADPKTMRACKNLGGRGA